MFAASDTLYRLENIQAIDQFIQSIPCTARLGPMSTPLKLGDPFLLVHDDKLQVGDIIFDDCSCFHHSTHPLKRLNRQLLWTRAGPTVVEPTGSNGP